MDLYALSSNFLYAAFILYLIATLFFGATIGNKREANTKSKASKIAITVTILGFITQLTYFFIRWSAAGHAPVSNMFEFIAFFRYDACICVYYHLLHLSRNNPRVICSTNRYLNYRIRFDVSN